jgi:phage gpG-like protein
MGVQVSINFDKVKSLSATQMMVRERMKSMENWKSPLKVIAAVMYRGVILNFRTQGSRAVPGGWKPLSPVTIAMRRKGRGHGGPRILQDSGALIQNVNPAATDSEATVTSNMPYSLAMQKGLPRRPGMVAAYTRRDGSKVKAHATTLARVPARPFMILNADDKRSIDKVALMWLQGLTGGSDGQ